MKRMSITKILANNLKRLRKERRMNQAELAESAGISTVMISQYETASKWPTPQTVTALAKALKVQETELFVDSNTYRTEDSLNKLLSEITELKQTWGKRETHEIVNAFLKADERVQTSVAYLLGLKDHKKKRT